MTFNVGELQATLGIDDSGMDSGISGALGKLQDFAARGGALAAAAGAAIGAGLALAISAAFDADTLTRKIQASLGTTEAESAKLGKSAGSLFAKNYGDSLAEVGDALVAVQRNMSDLGGVSSEVLESITGQVISVAKVFEQDFNAVTRSAGQLVKTGLAANSQEALDIIVTGFQSGIDAAGDFLDTLDEYSTVFRSLGLDGKEATGLLSQGLKAGARDADVVADALKEMLLRIQSGDAAAGIKALGLNFAALRTEVAKGGDAAKTATDIIFDGLRKVEDPATRGALAVEVFGTKAEDLQAAIAGLDVTTAVDGLGNVAGAAKNLDEVVGGSLQGAFESVWRSMSGFATQAGAELMPAISLAAAAFAGLFDILRGALEWLGDVPVELWAIGAAVGVWASWGAIAAGASALAAAVVSLGVAAKGALIAIGPLGWALAAAGAAWALFSSLGDDTEAQIERQTEKMDALRATLDATTGAITDATRAEFVRQAQADGTLDLLEQLGISTKLYTDASLGNADAQKEFAAALDAAGSSSKTTAALFGDMADDISKAGISQQELTDAVNSGDWSGVTAKMNAYAEGVARQTGNVSDATAITNGFATAMQGAQGPLGALGELYGQTGLTAQTLSEAQADAAQRTTAMGDAAGDAYAQVYAAAVISGKSADEIARMGQAAGLSAEEIAKIQDAASKANPEAAALAVAMQEGSSAASELDAAIQMMQIALETLAGNTISAEQAQRAHNAVIREVAAAGREKADADRAQAEAQAKVNELTAQGITSGAEYEAAQRALTEATSDAADASDDAADKLDQLAESAVGQMERSFEAAGGMANYQAAVEAATAKMVEQRAQFIGSAKDAGYSQEAAENLANAQGLIPENVPTTYEARRYQEAIRAAQDTKGAVDNIPPSKTVDINANDNATPKLLQVQQYKIADKTFNIYPNQVNFGGAKDSGVGYSPGIYTGGQVGRVMAISAAMNRALGLPGFSNGGQVPGTPPADPTKDNVLASAMGLPIMLRSREWVMPEEAVDLYGPEFMRAIQLRRFPKLPGYVDGGSVSPVITGGQGAPTVNVEARFFVDGKEFDGRAELIVDGKLRETRTALQRKRSQSFS